MKHFFDEAWQDLKKVYLQGGICSERHMQCELFKLLTNNDEFNKKFQIFVEPRLPLEKTIIPDFIITSISKEPAIVGAVELKYVPHNYSKYQKDLATLLGFCDLYKNQPQLKFSLLTNPTNGEYNDSKIPFGDNLTIIYCIITRVDAYILTNHKELWKCDTDISHGKISALLYAGAIPANSDKNWGPVK